MEIGDLEWMKRVNETYSFPCTIATYITNKSRSLRNVVVETEKKSVNDMKYLEIAPNYETDDGERYALIEMKRITSAFHYKEWIKEIVKDWGNQNG